MTITGICLIAVATVSVFLLCGNIFLVLRHLSQKKKLDEVQKRTSLLLSTVAHDIRSPLTSVKGFADAMLDGTVDDEKKEQYLAVISSESDRLSRIASRLCENDDGALDGEVFGICEQIRRAYLLVEKKIEARDLSVDLLFGDDEIYVFANADACFEIVLNLFENAAKYCADAGSIAWKVEDKDQKVFVSVKNRTLPLDKNFDVFAPRERGKSATGAGFGLGLYISKKLALRMGTDISFRSYTEDNGEFCEFSICLPAADEI
ncbi:MAG: HAMP domain-containing histidine kinase [Ruminococcaceae bacterium]|nr:HAMP domain-containing histidine kinase [Oscillospiraceae bacterium]